MCPKCNRARGILSKDIFCEGCTHLLPLCKISDEYQVAWKGDTMCRFVCEKCEGNKRAQSFQYCAGCKRDWLTSGFEDAELTEEGAEAGRERHCIRCTTQSAHKHNGKIQKCSRCAKTKSWYEFSPILLRRLEGGHSKQTYFCEDSQYPKCATPTCTRVGGRMEVCHLRTIVLQCMR